MATEASLDDFKRLKVFLDTVRSEEDPEAPVHSLEYQIANRKAHLAFEHLDIQSWLAWYDDAIVGECFLVLIQEGENAHTMEVVLRVHPDNRRKGVARKLLRQAAYVAAVHGRRLLIGVTSSNVPAGPAFAERIGARRGLESHTNALKLDEIDRDLIRSWLQNGESLQDYKLGFWHNPLPAEELDAIAELKNVMNTAPRDDMEVEDEVMSPEIIREHERYQAARGVEYWMHYLRHVASGELVGYTEVYWEPEDARTVRQGDTAVLAEHRGKGLGKWLKAAMLRKVLRERSRATEIKTGNANSNAPMLAINRKLGFKPYISRTVWQLDLSDLENYLDGSGG